MCELRFAFSIGLYSELIIYLFNNLTEARSSDGFKVSPSLNYLQFSISFGRRRSSRSGLNHVSSLKDILMS